MQHEKIRGKFFLIIFFYKKKQMSMTLLLSPINKLQKSKWIGKTFLLRKTQKKSTKAG